MRQSPKAISTRLNVNVKKLSFRRLGVIKAITFRKFFLYHSEVKIFKPGFQDYVDHGAQKCKILPSIHVSIFRKVIILLITPRRGTVPSSKPFRLGLNVKLPKQYVGAEYGVEVNFQVPGINLGDKDVVVVHPFLANKTLVLQSWR